MSDEPDATDDDQPAAPTPITEIDAVADQLANGEYELATSAVMDELTTRYKAAETEVDRGLALRAAGEAVDEIAAEAADPKAIGKRVEEAASNVAQQTSTPANQIAEPVKDHGLRDRIDDHREERVSGGIEVPVGVGLDTYLEEYLETVIIQRSTDHADDPRLRWRFSDGARVETSESAHHDYYQFYQKLNAATSKRLVPEVASEQLEEELRDDEAVDGETYGKLSIGPKDRPWHTQNKLWSRAISGLVEERAETVTVTGRRTDAWETLQNRIATGRAVEDLTDAVKHEMVYVDAENSEVWVPSSFVDKAADTVEVTRRAMQAELSERGVTVADHGGGRVSESVIRAGTARRFWRFDLDAEAVPEPSEILEEIEEVNGDMLRAVGPAAGETTGTTEETSKSYGGGPAATDGGEETETSETADSTSTEKDDANGGDDGPDDTDVDGSGGEAE